jgi:hypothetical protein
MLHMAAPVHNDLAAFCALLQDPPPPPQWPWSHLAPPITDTDTSRTDTFLHFMSHSGASRNLELREFACDAADAVGGSRQHLGGIFQLKSKLTLAHHQYCLDMGKTRVNDQHASASQTRPRRLVISANRNSKDHPRGAAAARPYEVISHHIDIMVEQVNARFGWRQSEDAGDIQTFEHALDELCCAVSAEQLNFVLDVYEHTCASEMTRHGAQAMASGDNRSIRAWLDVKGACLSSALRFDRAGKFRGFSAEETFQRVCKVACMHTQQQQQQHHRHQARPHLPTRYPLTHGYFLSSRHMFELL